MTAFFNMCVRLCSHAICFSFQIRPSFQHLVFFSAVSSLFTLFINFYFLISFYQHKKIAFLEFFFNTFCLSCHSPNTLYFSIGLIKHLHANVGKQSVFVIPLLVNQIANIHFICALNSFDNISSRTSLGSVFLLPRFHVLKFDRVELL